MDLIKQIYSNRILKAGLCLLSILSLSGCVRLEYFGHGPTADVSRVIRPNAFNEHQEFIDENILFVPIFFNLTREGDLDGTVLRLYSQKIEKIYIHKAVIKAENVADRTIEINNEITIDLNAGQNAFYYNVPLVRRRAVSDEDMRKYKAGGVLYLEIYYSKTAQEPVKQMDFELPFRKRYDINWST
jgi:hypothetical protein